MIKDIAALRAAAATFGAQLADKKTFHSYQGESKCDFCIALPNVKYEIGVIRQPDGSMVLSHDPYGNDRISHLGCDGHKLTEKFGSGLKRLTQEYTVQTTMRAARAKGWTVVKKALPNGSVRLQLMSM